MPRFESLISLCLLPIRHQINQNLSPTIPNLNTATGIDSPPPAPLSIVIAKWFLRCISVSAETKLKIHFKDLSAGRVQEKIVDL